MTRAEIWAWAKKRTWHHEVESRPLEYTWNPLECITVCSTPTSYAECQGPDDPVCGRARFSVHGCAGAPSRAAFLAAMR